MICCWTVPLPRDLLLDEIHVIHGGRKSYILIISAVPQSDFSIYLCYFYLIRLSRQQRLFLYFHALLSMAFSGKSLKFQPIRSEKTVLSRF